MGAIDLGVPSTRGDIDRGSNYGWRRPGANDVANSRDGHETFQAETETRPRRKGPRLRRWAFCPRRDRERDIEGPRQDWEVPAPETLAETYAVWWKKIKHHKINRTSKHFVFVMLWDFAARALPVCALRGIAAVRPSVCSPSVTLRYRGHISWATSKIITLRRYGLRSWAPQHRWASLRGTPKNSGLTGVGCCFQQKTCIISETKQDRTKVTVDD